MGGMFKCIIIVNNCQNESQKVSVPIFSKFIEKKVSPKISDLSLEGVLEDK